MDKMKELRPSGSIAPNKSDRRVGMIIPAHGERTMSASSASKQELEPLLPSNMPTLARVDSEAGYSNNPASLSMRMLFLHQQIKTWHKEADAFMADLAAEVLRPIGNGGILHADGQRSVSKLMRSFEDFDYHLGRYEMRYCPELSECRIKPVPPKKDKPSLNKAKIYTTGKGKDVSPLVGEEPFGTNSSPEPGRNDDKATGKRPEHEDKRKEVRSGGQHHSQQGSQSSDFQIRHKDSSDDIGAPGPTKKRRLSPSGAKSVASPRTSSSAVRNSKDEEWRKMFGWLVNKQPRETTKAPKLVPTLIITKPAMKDPNKPSGRTSRVKFSAQPASERNSTTTAATTATTATTRGSVGIAASPGASSTSSSGSPGTPASNRRTRSPYPRLDLGGGASREETPKHQPLPEDVLCWMSVAVENNLQHLRYCVPQLAELRVARTKLADQGGLPAYQQHASAHKEFKTRVATLTEALDRTTATIRQQVPMTAAERERDKHQKRCMDQLRMSGALQHSQDEDDDKDGNGDDETGAMEGNACGLWARKEAQRRASRAETNTTGTMHAGPRPEPTRRQRLAEGLFRARIDAERLGVKYLSAMRKDKHSYAANHLVGLVETIDAHAAPNIASNELLALRNKVVRQLQQVDAEGRYRAKYHPRGGRA